MTYEKFLVILVSIPVPPQNSSVHPHHLIVTPISCYLAPSGQGSALLQNGVWAFVHPPAQICRSWLLISSICTRTQRARLKRPLEVGLSSTTRPLAGRILKHSSPAIERDDVGILGEQRLDFQEVRKVQGFFLYLFIHILNYLFSFFLPSFLSFCLPSFLSVFLPFFLCFFLSFFLSVNQSVYQSFSQSFSCSVNHAFIL